MQFSIASDRLLFGGRAVPFVPTPNQGGRIEPHLIVLHDTVSWLRRHAALDWFRDQRCRVSAHVVVEIDGSPTQLVDFDRAAWHAGKSVWRGRSGANAWSIGIEIVNPGPMRRINDTQVVSSFGLVCDIADCVEIETPEHGRAWWLPYTPEQIDAVHGIIRALADAYHTITEVVGHYHIAPRRKVDVGPQWPMAQSQALVAHRHAPDPGQVRAAQQRLAELGYWPGSVDGIMGPRTRSAIKAFQEQQRLPETGRLDEATRAALQADTAKAAVNAARESATKEDVRAVSGTATAAYYGKRATEVATAAVVTDALTGPAPQPVIAAPTLPQDALSGLDSAVAKVETARGLAGRLMALVDWITSPSGLKYAAVGVVLALIWWALHHVEWRRWRDHVTGRHIGGQSSCKS